MKSTEVLAAKALAKSNFKFGDLSFVEILNVNEKLFSEDDKDKGGIDIWAVMALSYDGEPPDTHRVLNSMVMDYTEDNQAKIGKLLADPLKTFFVEHFPDVDLSELMEAEDDVSDWIWEEQVDFSPEIDEENKKVLFSLELVIELEAEDEDDVEEEEK